MSLDARIQEVGPWRFAVARHTGPYTGIATAITKAVTWAGQNGLIGPDTVVVGVYYDNPEDTPIDQLRSAGGLTVPVQAKIEGDEVEELGFPAHRALVVTHKGSYETLPQTYNQVMAWMTEHGAEWAHDGPSVEHYVDDPTTTPEAELRTIIHIPVK